jgi:pimeloyl-ACP methyl ester carboxylesterase
MTRSHADRNAATTGQHDVERHDLPAAGRGAREQLVTKIPVVERRLQLAGVSTAVLDGGNGRPVVLLHGPGEFALTWMRVVPGLVATHRVIAPDLPGHGASQVTDGRLDTGHIGELLAPAMSRSEAPATA